MVRCQWRTLHRNDKYFLLTHRGHNVYMYWFFFVAHFIQVIGFTFTNFDLELDSSCSYDRLTVYDGATTSAPSLGIFCGSDTPRPIITTGDVALLVFESDGSITGGGFSVDYSADEQTPPTARPPVPTAVPPESKKIYHTLYWRHHGRDQSSAPLVSVRGIHTGDRWIPRTNDQ